MLSILSLGHPLQPEPLRAVPAQSEQLVYRPHARRICGSGASPTARRSHGGISRNAAVSLTVAPGGFFHVHSGRVRAGSAQRDSTQHHNDGA